MSMSYYGIVGYGVNVEKFANKINKDKLISLLKDEDVYEEGYDDYTSYLNGQPYNWLAEMFWYSYGWFDNILTYEDSENCSYLYYPAMLPWELKPSEKSINKEDVDEVIIDTIQSLADVSRSDILSEIGYINDSYLG